MLNRSWILYKLAIAKKELNETMYWLELLKATNYINNEEFSSLNIDSKEIMKLLTSIIKSTKSNLKH